MKQEIYVEGVIFSAYEIENFIQDNIELNSGEICPGNKSLEPFVGTILTLEEK